MFSFTVFDLLDKNVPGNAEHTALVLNGAEFSYGELHDRVEKTAAWLYEAGVQRGDRVGIHLPKSVEEVVATFAIARLGAVFVNINYQWTENQLEFVVKDCGVRVLFTDARKAKRLAQREALGEIEHFVVKGKAPEHENMTAWESLPQCPEPPVDLPAGVDLAALLYTSGSTGSPKGVMLSHQNIVLGARSVARYLNNTAKDRILSLPPLSFDYGLNQITTMFLVGGSVVLQPVSIPAEIAKTVTECHVTGLALVAPSWVQLGKYLDQAPSDFCALRYLTNTGGKIPRHTLEAMPKHFPGTEIYLMYGLTEAFRSTYLDPSLFNDKMGAIGKAVPGEEIFVVDPVHGIRGPGEQGELIHRGGLISLGYWNNLEVTAEKIRPNKHLRSVIGEEKVLHSGDLVRMDQDGDLWFVGRMDSMIKCSGFRLSPTEVEDMVCLHPDVFEAVAFGVDDDELGQVVHVAISSNSGEDVNIDELGKFCMEKLPKYMIPRKFHCRQESMPRTPNGKIDRQLVIEQSSS